MGRGAARVPQEVNFIGRVEVTCWELEGRRVGRPPRRSTLYGELVANPSVPRGGTGEVAPAVLPCGACPPDGKPSRIGITCRDTPVSSVSLQGYSCAYSAEGD